MEAVQSPEMFWTSTGLHGIMPQKSMTFIATAVGISNFTYFQFLEIEQLLQMTVT
jgi:hypothetical protein